MKLFTCPCAAVVVILGLGCGSSDDTPDLARVSGVVSHAGTPVPNLRIVFAPTGGGRSSSAQSDEDGRFTLKYTRENEGVLLGEHRVSVSYTPTDTDEFAKSSAPGYRPPEPYGTIVAKYGNAATSPLTVMVEQNESGYELKLD